MADEVDLANDAASRFLEESLVNRTRGPKLPPKGSCYSCEMEFEAHTHLEDGTPVDAQGTALNLKLFCDRACADDYAHYQKLKSQIGG